MIPYGKHYIDESDIQAVTDVLRNGLLTQGPKVKEFELAIANYVGAKFAVAVNSGTSALHLAAIVAGMSPGKSLITSPITFVASANASLYAGGDVHFADIDPQTINISPQSLKESVQKNSNIKAIIPVHFSGLPCDMSEIKKIADEANAIVIEDAAHALGAKYQNGMMVGCCSHSLMTIFSFHPVKAVAAGEGGVVTTNCEDTYHQLLRLRSHGINKGSDPLVYPDQKDKDGLQAQWYYEMQELGYNYRITDIQSALALSQLKKLDLFVQRRKMLVKKYDQEFAEFGKCRPAQSLGREFSGHHLYVLRIDFKKAGISRQRFMKTLRDHGIGSQVHYIPIPMQPKYKQLGHDVGLYPNALNYYEQAISIPLYYSLSDDEQAYVISVIKTILE